jgi:AAA domain
VGPAQDPRDGAEHVIGDAWSDWRSTEKSVLVITGKQKVTTEREAWSLFRNPLPAAAENEVIFGFVREAIQLRPDRFVTQFSFSDINDAFCRDQFADDVLTPKNDLGFFQRNNPVVRHVVLRKRSTLERLGLIPRIPVDIHPLPGSHMPPMFEGLGLRTSVVTNAELQEQYFPANDDFAPLPVIDPRQWQGKSIPEREWFVEGLIPHRTVTNLSGADGSGKTEIVLQMVVASALRTDWFGKAVAAGPCLYYGAEDEADELHRRLATIVQRAGKQLSDLDNIWLIPMAGLDAVLAEPDRAGKILGTDLLPKLKAEANALNPKLIIIDPSADVFGGDEINRSQVRSFVSMLRAVAIDHDCAVLLLSHPSLTGLNTGTGTKRQHGLVELGAKSALSGSAESRNAATSLRPRLKVVKSN